MSRSYETMMEAEAAARKPRGRSPSYPAIDLTSAIQKAEKLHSENRQHWVPVDDVARQWGYRSLNGPASVTLAALKKFGLLEDQGNGPDRRARVTNLAVDILAHPSGQRRTAAIQEAALTPAAHRELWDKYGTDLPPDGPLKWELTREREPRFTESGAVEFIREYRATMAFAQLAEGDMVATQTPSDEDRVSVDDDAPANDPPPGKRGHVQSRRRVGGVTETMTAIPFPIKGHAPVVLEGEFPISKAAWRQIMAVLVAMEPLLTQDDEDSED